jgi:hypothetical protein
MKFEGSPIFSFFSHDWILSMYPTMMSSVSLHISGRPAPSIGGLKQDPKAKSDTHSLHDPEKNERKISGVQKIYHESTSGFSSCEENVSERNLQYIAGDSQSHSPDESLISFSSL